MDGCNAYESESMREALGDTLRPGGFSLTEKAIRYCKISADDRVLDLGCGRGATVNYLYQSHGIRAAGADPSEKLIAEAKKQYGYADFFLGKGEDLPFSPESFHGVLAECTLSLMDADRTLTQVHRVLKNKGWFIITDVYAKNPEAMSELEPFAVNSCVRKLHNLPLLKEKLRQADFEIALEEDCSHFLKELFVRITFSYGSMSAFWNAASRNCVDGYRFHEALKKCRPGYFILISRKAGSPDG